MNASDDGTSLFSLSDYLSCKNAFSMPSLVKALDVTVNKGDGSKPKALKASKKSGKKSKGPHWTICARQTS